MKRKRGLRTIADYPELAQQWHPTKNGPLAPHDIASRSSKKVWWKCAKGADHEWQTTCASRVAQGTGCPFCSNRRACRANCLATMRPEIAKEWHPTKNGTLTPFDVVPGTEKKVWWRCPRGHEYLAMLDKRTGVGRGCAYCAHQKATRETSLASVAPKLAAEWHPTKNGALTPHDAFPTSKKVMWWRCSKQKNHEWKATIGHRSRGRGCPFCAGRLVIARGRVRRKRRIHGVEPLQESSNYIAKVFFDGRRYSCGAWPTQKAAGIARDRAVLFLGAPRRLNFPKQATELGPCSPDELRRRALLVNKELRVRSSPYLGVHRDTRLTRRTGVGAAPVEMDAGLAARRDRTLPLTGSNSRPWHATLKVKDLLWLGAWPSAEAAALARDRAVLYYFGDTTKWRLNFPEKARRLGPLDADTLVALARQHFKQFTTSRFRGVSWSSRMQAWIAALRHNHKPYYCGRFTDEERAAEAYDKVAIRVLKGKARLNFHPETGEQLFERRLAPRIEQQPKSRTRKRS